MNKRLFITGIIFLLLLATSATYFSGSNANTATAWLWQNDASDHCIALLTQNDRQAGEYTVQKARINTDDTTDYILKGRSDNLCGSAGCIYELCIYTDTGMEILPFGYAAEAIELKGTATQSMYDIQLIGKSSASFQWTGDKYTLIN